METEEIKTKKCSKCGRELPLDAFHKKSSTPDGYQYHCKECAAIYAKNGATVKDSPIKDSRAELPKAELLSGVGAAQLVAELRKRGYEVTCVKVIREEL